MALNLGENMRLSIDGKEILHEVSASLSYNKDFKEVASKDTNGKLVAPGSSSWNLSIEGLWENDGSVKEDLFSITTKANTNNEYPVIFTTGVSGDPRFSGNGFIEGFSIDATNEEYVTFSFTVKGNGDLAIAQEA